MLLLLGGYTHAQVAPSATSGGANLNYAIRYSESGSFGGSTGNWQTSSVSGSAGYTNGREDRPFRLNYSGGHSWNLSGPSYASGLFQRLLLSQGWNWRTWNLTLSDDVDYTPQAPTTGFAGIPGIGEPIGTPNPAPPSSFTVQTLGTHVVTNNSSAQVGHILNYALSMSVGGSSNMLRFVSSNGLNTDSRQGNAGLTYRVTARSSFAGQYSYMQFSYPDYDFSFQENSANFSFQRSWTQDLSTSFSAGPSWISSSGNIMPSSTLVNAMASARYTMHTGSAAITYSRGTSGGSGYMVGGVMDTVSGTYSRQLMRTVSVELSAGYDRLSSLSRPGAFGYTGSYSSEFGSIQTSRKFGRFINAFASYTALTQSPSAAAPANVLNTLLQSVSFGIGYSRETNPAR